MIYKPYKDTGKQLSQLGFGCMRLPTTTGNPGDPIDYDKAGALIDYAYEHGVNYFDSAYVYGSLLLQRRTASPLMLSNNTTIPRRCHNEKDLSAEEASSRHGARFP